MRDIKLDADVISREGNKVGTVDRIIVHPESLHISGIVVHEGTVFTTDRIVEEEFIDRIDNDGNVVLNVSEEDEEDLPALAGRRYTEADDSVMSRLSDMNYLTTPSAAGQVMVLSEPVDDRYAPAPDSPIQPAPADAPNIVDEDNLPQGTVTVDEGTDVVDINGEKIGTVEDVIYGDDDHLEAIIIAEGLLFKDHVRVPASWIESLGHESIRLNRTADDAEAAGKID